MKAWLWRLRYLFYRWLGLAPGTLVLNGLYMHINDPFVVGALWRGECYCRIKANPGNVDEICKAARYAGYTAEVVPAHPEHRAIIEHSGGSLVVVMNCHLDTRSRNND